MRTSFQIAFFTIMACCQLVYGQIVREPLKVNGTQFNAQMKWNPEKIRPDYLQKTTTSDTISIPFFDDFSRTDLSWAPSPFYFSQSINQIRFFSNKNGRGFGDHRLGIKTTDWGRTWKRIDTTNLPDIYSVSFPQNDGNGWACGAGGWLAQTADTGNSWQDKSSPAGNRKLISINFNNITDGLLVDDTGRIFATSNGGNSWTTAIFNANFRATDVLWVSSSLIISVGDSAKTAQSTDGGLTWDVVRRNPKNNQTFRKIRLFPSITTPFIMAIGDSGSIFRAVTSGGNWFWYQVQSKSYPYLSDLDFSSQNKNIGWAVGKDGALMASMDAGNSWLQIRSGTRDHLNCVKLINEFRGWIGTSNGRILQVVIDPTRAQSRFWERNSGTYVNNTYGVDPISFGVVSFDGLNAMGLPYADNVTRSGPCDTLTSTHLDLSGTGSQNLNLSFYWQPGGSIMELIPNELDSLVLQFKTTTDEWVSVWRQFGIPITLNVPFRYAAIPIVDSLKYRGFQFRFINHGNMSGNFDTWNLDYVRLDDAHNSTDSSSTDFALTSNPTQLLKNHHAFPLEQYNYLIQNNLRTYFSDSIQSQMINLNEIGNHNMRGSFRIISEKENEVLKEVPFSDITGFGFLASQNSRHPLRVSSTTYFSSLPVMPEETTLKYGFILDEDEIFNPITTNSNDTLYNRLNLSSYMAYDDGTAELTKLNTGNLAKGAVRFFLPKTDTLTDIMMMFPRSPYTQQQTIFFTLILYRDINVETNTETPIFRFPVALPPADSVNKFDYFNLRSLPINQRILEGGRNFYIGWQQGTIDNGNEVRIGSDINSSNPGTFLYTIGTSWFVDTRDDFPLMFRPVFGIEKPLSVKDLVGNPKSKFFPNPAKTLIRNQDSFRNLEIYNALGQLVFSEPNPSRSSEVQINLKDGLYVMKWQEIDGQWVSQRLIVNGR